MVVDLETKEVKPVIKESYMATVDSLVTGYKNEFIIFTTDAGGGIMHLNMINYNGQNQRELTQGLSNETYFPRISFDVLTIALLICGVLNRNTSV